MKVNVQHQLEKKGNEFDFPDDNDSTKFQTHVDWFTLEFDDGIPRTWDDVDDLEDVGKSIVGFLIPLSQFDIIAEVDDSGNCCSKSEQTRMGSGFSIKDEFMEKNRNFHSIYWNIEN